MKFIPLMYVSQYKHISWVPVNTYIAVKAKSKFRINNAVASGKYAQVTSYFSKIKCKIWRDY